MNEFLSTLSDPMRKEYLGRESMNSAHGSDEGLAMITGVPAPTIAKLRRQQQMSDGQEPAPSDGRVHVKTARPK
jgi:hypothetical protein